MQSCNFMLDGNIKYKTALNECSEGCMLGMSVFLEISILRIHNLETQEKPKIRPKYAV